MPLPALCRRHALGVQFSRYRPQRLPGIELRLDGARNGHSALLSGLSIMRGQNIPAMPSQRDALGLGSSEGIFRPLGD